MIMRPRARGAMDFHNIICVYHGHCVFGCTYNAHLVLVPRAEFPGPIRYHLRMHAPREDNEIASVNPSNTSGTYRISNGQIIQSPKYK